LDISICRYYKVIRGIPGSKKIFNARNNIGKEEANSALNEGTFTGRIFEFLSRKQKT